MAARYQRRTKNLFIKKDFQGKMILAVFIAVSCGSVLFLLLLALFSADTMTISYADSGVQVNRTVWVLFQSAIAANWIFLVLGGTLLVIAAMIGTHRIAGPLFRFEKTLETMIDGNLTATVHLREKDEGKELAGKFNEFNSMLSKRLHIVDHHTEAINDLLDQYDRLGAATATSDDVESICKAIRHHNDKIRKQIEHFTISND